MTAQLEGAAEEALSRLLDRFVESALKAFEAADIDFDVNNAAADVLVLPGLIRAAQDEIERLGPKASNRLIFAERALSACITLSLAISEQRGAPTSHQAIVNLIWAAVEIGRSEALVTVDAHGWFEELGDLDGDRERRRDNAFASNAKKRALQHKALELCRAKSKVNPSLSNEELALKLHPLLGGDRSIRTITGWIRNWRRMGLLPARIVLAR